MASFITTGNIREISRDDRKLSFEWKISNAISKLGCYRSPGITGWRSALIAFLARKSDSEAYKLAICEYQQTNSNTRFHYSVSIKNADDVEEELVHDEILQTIDSCIQQTLPLNVNMSQITPSGTLIVICTVWIDERFSGGGKTVVPRKMKTSSGSHTSARQVARANPDIKDFHSTSSQMTYQTASCVTEMETLPSVCQSRSSQTSPYATGSVTDKNRQSTGCQSSSSQMSLEATGGVTDANRQTTDGAQSLTNNVRHTSTEGNENEILEYGMLFISENLPEVVKTRGWKNFNQRYPDRTTQLLIKAMDTIANKT